MCLLRLCRWYYALPMGFILGLTIVYARGGEWSPAEVVVPSLALSLVVAAGYAFNDVCDRRVDQTNAPDRPIAAGRVGRVAATAWAACLVAAGLGLAATGRGAFAAGLACVAGGLVLYDLVSKHVGIGKQIAVAALTTSIYPLAVLQVGSPAGDRVATLWFFAAWLFATSFAYEILKDIRDIPGDRLVAARPGWVARHPRAARRVSSAATMLGAVVLIGPGFAGCGSIYLGVIGGAVAPAVASVFLPPRRAIIALYLEYVVVGIAATADLAV